MARVAMKRRPILPVIVTLVWGALAVASVVPVMMSPMLFDSGESIWAWALFSATLSFPILCVVSVVASWIVWIGRRDAPTCALWLPVAAACVPLVSVAVIAIVMGWGALAGVASHR